jgi:hypothetical protein
MTDPTTAEILASILLSTKKTLGIAPDYTAFDPDIIMHINTALSDLTDIGIGPSQGFVIADETALWADFLGDTIRYEAAKTWTWLKVRTLFDPPEGRYAIQATDGQLAQMLWRLNVNRENQEWVDPDPDIQEDTILSGGN